MNPTKEILDNFENDVLSAVAKANDRGVPLADVMRPYLEKAPETSIRYRATRLVRQDRIRVVDVAGRKVLLPAEVQE